MDYKVVLDNIAQAVKPLAGMGKNADYIPALANVDPDKFGMCIVTADRKIFETGDAEERFSLQSISKVLALAVCLSLRGEELWERVGKEPSGTAFNSLVQLEVEHGLPRNPFINAGALVLADIMLTSLENPEDEFLAFVREIGRAHV